MHYILLSIALNLGKENISLIKIKDLKPAKQNIVKELPKIQENLAPKIDLTDETLISPESFMVDQKEFSTPYIGSNDFAELLPEDEFGNVIQESEEEQGPAFLNSIKNKLINITSKEDKTVTGEDIKTPSFIETIKNKISGKETIKDSPSTIKTEEENEESGPTLLDKFKNIELDKIKDKSSSIISDIKDKTSDTINTVSKNLENKKETSSSFIDSVKQKTADITSKISDTISSNKNKKTVSETVEEKIVGTRFDSELDQVLKDENKYDILKDITVKENIEYIEDEEYKKFLEQKEIENLAKPEKIVLPSVKPRKKEYFSYKTQKVPQELMETRSFQNRHIPKIEQKKEKEELLYKLIEYGMLEELKAFIRIEGIDSNSIMNNQYTLLTYATKHKQYSIMTYLIYKGSDVNKRDERLDTPLLIAVKNNDLEAVKLLINSNVNLEKTDIIKRTPLILAIEKDYNVLANYLIDNGANLNAKNGIGEDVLAIATRLRRNAVKPNIIKKLQEKNDKKI